MLTLEKNPRSIAYLMSFVVTARSTGGENFHPSLILTVTVQPSSATCGSLSASWGSLTAASSIFGAYSVAWVARMIWVPIW